MAQGDLVRLSLGAFALVKGFEFRIGDTGSEGGLEEARAQDLDPAFAHLGLAFELPAFLEPWIVSHEGLLEAKPFASGIVQLSYECVPTQFVGSNRGERG